MSFGAAHNGGQDLYQYNSYPTSQTGYGSYITDGGGVCSGEESNFWSNSPRSDTPSPTVGRNSYQMYTGLPFQSEMRQLPYRQGYVMNPVPSENGTSFVRVVKRRTTANKKERRRTQSINNAYADLRDCIPNVPADTKLSKIKTLRLATSYISYLTEVLETDDPAGGFKAELNAASRRNPETSMQINESTGSLSPENDLSDETISGRRAKGRTGWPQHVWALELKQEQAL